jgi:hypothetical protein
MRHAFATVVALSLSTAAFAGKTATPNPQIAYLALSGQSSKLYVANEDGSNLATLYSSATAFRFDLAPRSQHQIAIIDSSTSSTLKLLTYAPTTSGSFVATGVQTLAPARRGGFPDFSPDGTKIAYPCNPNNVDSEQLCVYDLTTSTSTVWGTDSFYWDLAWFRGGASIAYSTSDSDGFDRLHEITGPGATPTAIFATKGDLYLDAARTNPDALVLNYNDAGSAVTGLWQAPTAGDPLGHFINANMTNSTFSFYSELNCNDTKVVYLGPPNTSSNWYIRDLTTGLSTIFSRSSLHWVQYWPTCS